MSHYETLGIKPDATTEDVKRAYRKKASESHPDRHGGDASKMSAVNKARDILIDPRRRQAYDETGDDKPDLPIAEQANQMLCTFFAAALAKDVPNLMVAVRQMLSIHQMEAKTQMSDARAKRGKLVKRRDKIRTKDGARNMAHLLIDDTVMRLDAVLANGEEALQLNAAAAALADSYESDEEVELAMPAFRGTAFRFGGSGLT